MKMGIAMPNTHAEEFANNPFLILGFGINAYFKIIKAMLYMMFWVCIANIPLFYIFSQYDTHKGFPLASLSLGNMGGADSICK
jgi:hypothetical protein